MGCELGWGVLGGGLKVCFSFPPPGTDLAATCNRIVMHPVFANGVILAIVIIAVGEEGGGGEGGGPMSRVASDEPPPDTHPPTHPPQLPVWRPTALQWSRRKRSF